MFFVCVFFWKAQWFATWASFLGVRAQFYLFFWYLPVSCVTFSMFSTENSLHVLAAWTLQFLLGKKGGIEHVNSSFLRVSLILRRSIRWFTMGLSLAAKYACYFWSVDPSRRVLISINPITLYEKKGSLSRGACTEIMIWFSHMNLLKMFYNWSINAIKCVLYLY